MNRMTAIFVVISLAVVAAGCGGSASVSMEGASPQDVILAATLAGDAGTVSSCLDQNPDWINAYDSQGKTLLHIAAMNSHADVVEILLQRGANANARDMYGDTPLLAAEDYDASDEVLDLLRAAGAS